jgi:hypothetical protein
LERARWYVVAKESLMTDEFSAEQVSFEADLDRLRAHFGMARLEQSSRRGIGDQVDPAERGCGDEDGTDG